jgi:phage tail sheath protein FI
MLGNMDEYIFNIISVPGLVYSVSAHRTPMDSVISLAETRGDCIAVVDLHAYNGTITNVKTEASAINSSYAAAYWPWVQLASSTGKNEFCPASVVIPGVYAFTDGATAPWFAPAGLVRGGIPTVIQAERKLTRGSRDELYSANINPIATFPGQGIAVFGQKTLQKKASALDRVNVRRLLIALKKFIGDQAKNLIFEQNTNATRNRFLAAVNPFLESVVQRQGLYAFRVVMDDSNNTPDVIDRNQLIGQIFIQPAKTVEFIVLDFTIEPTGATFNA